MYTKKLQNPFNLCFYAKLLFCPCLLSACGKTSFVKDLLYHLSSRVLPTIDRLVWLYRRWQPMYTDIQSTVTPSVEFHQGIPSDLEDDEFFDPKLNNLLILDDLHSTSGKDKRITDLFTEGSHHRSLSIISINQNLYASKDPTQRRNCHYLVLFNNPVDKQSIMTLARQMYPGNAELFMKSFDKATKYPYNFLLMDLKPFTPDHERLKCSVKWYDSQGHTGNDVALKSFPHSYLPLDHVTPRKRININEPPESNHSKANYRSVYIEPIKAEYSISLPAQTKQGKITEDNMADNSHACDDCGLLFENVHDLQRHVKNWCPEKEDLTLKRKLPVEETTKEIPPKRQRTDQMTDKKYNDQEAAAYKTLLKRAKKMNKDDWGEKYDEYIKRGLTEKEAKRKANTKLEHWDVKQFMLNYKILIWYLLKLRGGHLHQKVMKKVDKFLEQGYNDEKAIQMAIKVFQHNLEGYLETTDSDDDTSESETETEDETEDEETEED